MQSLVRKFEAESKDRSTKLEQKKEKSFAKGDSEKWEMEPQTAKTIDKKDRKQAWEAMFPKESSEVRRIADESQYFIDQLYQEVRRVILDNLDQMVLDTDNMNRLLDGTNVQFLDST